MSKSRLDGKVTVVTGGASGIGKATAQILAENGAVVIIVDIQDDLGNQVTASICREKCVYRHCDVRKEDQVKETMEYIIGAHNKIDVVFSNAGIIGLPGSILDMDLNELDSVMAVNLRGCVAVLKHGARAMIAKGTRGSIIYTASVAASLGGLSPHSYAVSKHAVVGLVRSAASELGKHGIRVNCVSPSGVATPFACGPLGVSAAEIEAACSAVSNMKGVVLKAEEHVAKAVLFLASDDSELVTGHNLCVDGGFTVVNYAFHLFD